MNVCLFQLTMMCVLNYLALNREHDYVCVTLTFDIPFRSGYLFIAGCISIRLLVSTLCNLLWTGCFTRKITIYRTS